MIVHLSTVCFDRDARKTLRVRAPVMDFHLGGWGGGGGLQLVAKAGSVTLKVDRMISWISGSDSYADCNSDNEESHETATVKASKKEGVAENDEQMREKSSRGLDDDR